MRGFVESRIKPYYLHHGDLAPGTTHFRVTIAEGQAIMGALRARLSGLARQPIVLDIPGGHGKVPIGPGYVETGEAVRVRDAAGDWHDYGGPLREQTAEAIAAWPLLAACFCRGWLNGPLICLWLRILQCGQVMSCRQIRHRLAAKAVIRSRRIIDRIGGELFPPVVAEHWIGLDTMLPQAARRS